LTTWVLLYAVAAWAVVTIGVTLIVARRWGKEHEDLGDWRQK
jgi:hypothetical protein